MTAPPVAIEAASEVDPVRVRRVVRRRDAQSPHPHVGRLLQLDVVVRGVQEQHALDDQALGPAEHQQRRAVVVVVVGHRPPGGTVSINGPPARKSYVGQA
jgi:hypothetical protein